MTKMTTTKKEARGGTQTQTVIGDKAGGTAVIDALRFVPSGRDKTEASVLNGVP
jgi:hypothetical protein